MKTYTAQFEDYWHYQKTVTVAAPTFKEAWDKVKKLMKGYSKPIVLSIVQTAKLDA